MIPISTSLASRHRFRLLLIALVATLAGGSPREAAAASFPAPRGRGGAVAADQRVAVEVGLDLLRRGGNAADAAVGAALALAVVHPEAGNLGGGGFAVIRFDGETASLDFRETAPAAARRDMYLDAEGRPIADASLVGPLAAGVPGSPAGLFELHRRWGTLPWSQVVDPARRLAEEGFAVSSGLHQALHEKRKLLARFPETARVWLPGGEPPAIGETVRLPALARTLTAYGERGPEALVEGPLAEAVERASARHGGILTAADLSAYRAEWRAPVRFEAFGWEFASMDLPASGGIIVGQAMTLLERLGWQKLPRFGARRAHLLTEVLRRSFADRFLLGDPSTTEVDSRLLLGGRWLSFRQAGIRRDRASLSSEVARWPRETPREKADTTHVSALDGNGNLVALTTTLNGLFGCGLLVPETGFLLNNEMDDFAVAPGTPNLFGLIQGEANAVRPGRRMLSSMSPTVGWAGPRGVALGGRGGSEIPTATLQVLLNLLVDGDDLQAALNRPRIHHQWLPDRLEAEPDALSPETWAALEQMGHRIEIDELIAKVHAVSRGADGLLEAAADPREPGAAGVAVPVGSGQ